MKDEYLYSEAQKIVRKKKRFYRHLGVYIAVNSAFFFIILFQDNSFDWLIPASLWGIGLFIHYFNAFGLPGRERLGSSEWEQNEIEKELQKMGANEDNDAYPNIDDELKLKEIKPVSQKKWNDSDLV